MTEVQVGSRWFTLWHMCHYWRVESIERRANPPDWNPSGLFCVMAPEPGYGETETVRVAWSVLKTGTWWKPVAEEV